MIKRVSASALSILCVLFCAGSAPAAGKVENDGLELRHWTVDGLTRVTKMHIPPEAKTTPSPVVFVFHGHGGTLKAVVEEFEIHKHWPNAIVVYMRGVPTPQGDDPEGKKTGWQYHPGDQGDRDVHFFDAVLADLHTSLKVDDSKVFAAGFSNGGAFATVLWSARPDKVAAVATVSMPVIKSMQHKIKPKACMMVAGRTDPLHKMDEMEASAKKVVEMNQCQPGQPWSAHSNCTLYPSDSGNPVLFMTHGGAYMVPHEAQAVIVDFFKNQVK
jgi:polyhydroxybutyrate depolymerase